VLEVSVHTGQSELVKVQVNKYELKNNTLKKRIMKRRKSIRRII